MSRAFWRGVASVFGVRDRRTPEQIVADALAEVDAELARIREWCGRRDFTV